MNIETEIKDRDWFTSDGVLKIQRLIRQELIESGVDPESPEIVFAAGRRWEELRSARESYRERNKRWFEENMARQRANAISTNTVSFTDDQMQYLKDKLVGVNDPVGLDILLLLNQIKQD